MHSSRTVRSAVYLILYSSTFFPFQWIEFRRKSGICNFNLANSELNSQKKWFFEWIFNKISPFEYENIINVHKCLTYLACFGLKLNGKCKNSQLIQMSPNESLSIESWQPLATASFKGSYLFEAAIAYRMANFACDYWPGKYMK